MKGIVRAINPRKGMVAVETSLGYSILELLGDDVEIGDIISGNLDSLGSETVRNETQMENIEVFIQDCHCTAQHARLMLS
ncbi:hypothetical protein [Desulfovulcanus sp.]